MYTRHLWYNVLVIQIQELLFSVFFLLIKWASIRTTLYSIPNVNLGLNVRYTHSPHSLDVSSERMQTQKLED